MPCRAIDVTRCGRAQSSDPSKSFTNSIASVRAAILPIVGAYVPYEYVISRLQGVQGIPVAACTVE